MSRAVRDQRREEAAIGLGRLSLRPEMDRCQTNFPAWNRVGFAEGDVAPFDSTSRRPQKVQLDFGLSCFTRSVVNARYFGPTAGISLFVRGMFRFGDGVKASQIIGDHRTIIRDHFARRIKPDEFDEGAAARRRDAGRLAKRLEAINSSSLNRERLGPATVQTFASIRFNDKAAFAVPAAWRIESEPGPDLFTRRERGPAGWRLKGFVGGRC